MGQFKASKELRLIATKVYAMTTIVKVCFQEDIRRITLPKENPFDQLVKEVSRIYKGKFPNGIQVRYIDDEDDHVTVTSNMELLEAFDMSQATLKLFITPQSAEESDSEFVKVSKDGQRTAVLNSKVSKEDLAKEKKAEEAEKKAQAEAEAEAEAAKALAESMAKAAAKALLEEEEKAEAKKKAKEAAEKKARKAEREAKKAEREAKRKKLLQEKAFRAKLGTLFVKDVTIPDNMEVAPGQELKKTWAIKNNGSVAWPEGVHVGRSNKKGGIIHVADTKVPVKKPGEIAHITVVMKAPMKAGNHTSANYFLVHDGKKFGNEFWAIVKVKKTPKSKKSEDDVKEPKKEPKEEKAPKNAAPSKDSKKDPKGPCLGMHFIKDINIPDGALMAPSQHVTKSWLLKNTGEVAWPIGTKLVALRGSFGQDAIHEIKTVVNKGEQYQLDLAVTVPLKTGKHRANYQFSAPNGDKFGHKLWIDIRVSKFPNKNQLRTLAKDFLADEKVVDALQAELPMIMKEIRQGKKLASIVEILLTKRPELKNHQFVVFLQPFLQSAEKFMSLQLDALIQMYSILPMTPLASGATPAPEEEA